MQLNQTLAGKDTMLLYEPYMDYLWTSLNSAAPGLKIQSLDPDLRFQKSIKHRKGAEIRNWLLCSDRLRRIRCTYFDAGPNCQAFNSLLYPDHRFDYPLLGIDLLAFGKEKILCVVDFQPLSQEDSYLEKYTAGLAPIHKELSKFCSKMSTRIYNEDEFFSKYLIFYRSDRGGADPLLQVPGGLFFRTYVEYIMHYLKWLHSLDPIEDVHFQKLIMSRQAEYDKYSSERDPAIKVFASYFGLKWSEQFAKEFLFPLA